MKIASKTNRKSGFVLLTVVLVSTLLIISVMMFTAQLAAESRITKTDSVFKSALSLTEAGLNTALSDIKNNANAVTWAQRLEGGGYNIPVVPSTLMHGTTSITVHVLDAETHNRQLANGTWVASTGVADQWTAPIELTASGLIFPPSVTTANMRTSTDYMARRAVLTRAQATWTYVPAYSIHHVAIPGNPGTPAVPEVGHWQVTPLHIGYGVFTGGSFSTQGSAKEINGNVYSAGLATIKKDSIVNGTVQSSGGLAGNPPAGSIGNASMVNFPYIDLAYYKSLFTAYVNGTFPYDTPFNQIPGTGTYYTCTNGDYVGNKRGMYNVDALLALTQDWTDPVTSKVYKTIPSTNASTALAYMSNSTTSYFVSGDLHINAQTTLTGTLVVDGTIFVNGGANILAGTKAPAIMATGDFVRNNGNATINGLVYTEGSFTGNGTSSINGALYVKGEVNMSGTMDLTYDSSIADIVTGSTWVVEIPGQPAAPASPDIPAWDEPISAFYRMDDLTRIITEGSRVWVEVTPGS